MLLRIDFFCHVLSGLITNCSQLFPRIILHFQKPFTGRPRRVQGQPRDQDRLPRDDRPGEGQADRHQRPGDHRLRVRAGAGGQAARG